MLLARVWWPPYRCAEPDKLLSLLLRLLGFTDELCHRTRQPRLMISVGGARGALVQLFA